MIDGLKERTLESRKFLATLFAGALSLMFTQTLATYINGKLNEFNIFGVDPQIFELFAIGVLLVVLVWFGVVKSSSPQK
jgi:hypothetical protein